MTPLFKSFLLSLSLIVAIGAQNVFILRQALTNHYIFIVCLLCFLCDVILICVGIFGVGEIFAKNQILALILALCGVCFALYYAFLSLRAVFANSIRLQLAKENPPPLKKSDHFDFACYSCQSSCLFRYGFFSRQCGFKFFF